ncbi:hypothetical protein CPSG_04420 [Coccidioides posadasii str. Silveira]|uniref:Uncharacterized protein n=1 Tax=Coccidioides posadasii (strain RMSCC 757 / Silveira) TaxID=443226 RepID=E9D481_COCPS|nr:hypothetical protein CPSG_04420 [Coccidioides posadasii str. Silveira]
MDRINWKSSTAKLSSNETESALTFKLRLAPDKRCGRDLSPRKRRAIHRPFSSLPCTYCIQRTRLSLRPESRYSSLDESGLGRMADKGSNGWYQSHGVILENHSDL